MDQGSLSSLLNGLSYYPPGWKEVTLLRVIAQRPDGESVVVLLHPGDDDGRTASDVQTDGSNASNASNARTRTDRPESQDRPDIFFKSDDGVMLEENCKVRSPAV
jgi:hypothetical protein